MNPREIVLAQVRHHETHPVPYTLAFEPEVAERLDQHYGSDAWRQRIVPYMAHCGSVGRFPTEIVDDAHYRDAFGTLWRTDRLPAVVVEPGLKKPSFDNYEFPRVEVALDPALKADTERIAEGTTEAFRIINPGLCLWESWYIRGFEATLMDYALDEGFCTDLLERMTELTLALVAECADIEAEAIMMGDDWGDQRGVIIGPERWRRLVKPCYARIFQAIHDQGKIAIMHCCGSPADIMGDIVEIGLDILESVQPEAAGMNPYRLKEQWGDKITFWGGLGSQSTIPFGTPATIRTEVEQLRQRMAVGGGYILAPAKPLRPETPTANAVAVVEAFLDAQEPGHTATS
jgi:uroporphyrinogen decarboxylase